MDPWTSCCDDEEDLLESLGWHGYESAEDVLKRVEAFERHGAHRRLTETVRDGMETWE